MLEKLYRRRALLIDWINEYYLKEERGETLTDTETREREILMTRLAEVFLAIAAEEIE